MLRTDHHEPRRHRATDREDDTPKPDAGGLDADMRKAMRDALTANPRARYAAVTAFLEHVRTIDPALAYPLHTEAEHQRAAERLMRQEREAMAREAAAEAKKQIKMLPGPRPDGAGGEVQTVNDRKVQVCPDLPPTPSAQPAKAAQPSKAALTTAAMTTASATVWKGLLGSMTVNRKRLGDLTGAEAVAAGRAAFGRARGDVMLGRFLTQLADRLPPHDPIGRWTTPAVAADVWQRAQAWARAQERSDAS